jgi:hypothetical protein
MREVACGREVKSGKRAGVRTDKRKAGQGTYPLSIIPKKKFRRQDAV